MFLGERPIERIVLPGLVFQGCLVGLGRHLIEVPVAPPVGQRGQGVAVTHEDGSPLPRRQVGRQVVDAGHGGVQRLLQRLAEAQTLAFAPGRRRGKAHGKEEGSEFGAEINRQVEGGGEAEAPGRVLLLDGRGDEPEVQRRPRRRNLAPDQKVGALPGQPLPGGGRRRQQFRR